MAIKASQMLKQSQGLAMTPQLQQAIKLLTLTHAEMTNLIQNEMIENPMLEESTSKVDDKLENLENENKEATAENFKESTEIKSDDFDWDKYSSSFESNSSMSSSKGTSANEDYNYENMVSKGESLQEHLLSQISLSELSEDECFFAETIIGNLNDDGYLAMPFVELQKTAKISDQKSNRILNIIRNCDPLGCACETLQECLLFQATALEEKSSLLEKIIKYHLEDLKSANLLKVSSKIGITEEELKEVLLVLKKIHPKPGNLIAGNDTNFIIPDIFVVKIGDDYVVKVNNDGVPRLRISPLYQKMLTQKKNGFGNKDANEFVEEKIKSALFLIKSIQKRQKTIYRVAEAILREQQTFFKKGRSFLKPMILKDIADQLGVHESTVSRVTSNKYMHTPIGLFELKFFFSSRLSSDKGGIDISGESLKFKIKEMIDAENKAKPLSDQKIANLLMKDDIKIARRTVAKYRESLGVQSSSDRKIV